MPEEHEVLTTDEAAALLRVSTKTVLSFSAGREPVEDVPGVSSWSVVSSRPATAKR